MTAVVVNACFGGFGVSEAAIRHMGEHRPDGSAWPGHLRDLPRDDPYLVAAVRELGEAASDRYARLVVLEIPDGVPWVIEEYDGSEWVAEAHRTWNP